MRNNTSRNIAGFLARRRSRHIWQKIVIALSCLVVFCTTYALILPAITMEAVCGKAEHVHTADCLNCTLEEHTHTPECYVTPLSAEATPRATPLALQDYITELKLSYYDTKKEIWTVVYPGNTQEHQIPGDAQLKLEITYANVKVADLRAADLTMTYSLPPIFRAPRSSGDLTNGNTKMGTLTVENNVATLHIDDTWLTKHTESGESTIKGNFHVESPINLSEAADGNSPDIVMGGVNVNLNFEPDLIAEHADVTINKEVLRPIQDNTGDYMEYRLTVTAKQDGAQGVKVRDAFPDSCRSFVERYVGIPNGAEAGSPVEVSDPAGKIGSYSTEGSTMLWDIGDMDANEIRTLTYRVKLNKGYLGGMEPLNSNEEKIFLKNNAQLFCQGSGEEILRGEATGTFEPKAEATMSKRASAEYTPAPDGGVYVTYTIWIQALASNTYDLTHVKVWDALDGSISGGNYKPTPEKYLPYLSYKEGPFRLYDGGVSGQNGTDGLTGTGQAVTPEFHKNKDGTTNPCHHISCDVGTLKPGDCKTLIYQIHIKPDAIALAGSGAPQINNRAEVHAGEAGSGGSSLGNEGSLAFYSAFTEAKSKEWCAKSSGTKTEEDKAVAVTGRVYANGSLQGNAEGSFTVPAGSYAYTVKVNEAGDWDVSGTTLTDKVLDSHSSYIGYARVDAYNVNESGNRTLADTVWLNVDGGKSFSFRPADVDWRGKQAYVLTYYTHVNIVDYPMVTMENGFEMTGTVGIGTFSGALGATSVTVSDTIVGSGSFEVSKHSWYYEPAKVPATDATGNKNPYAYGTLYWYIQVDANVIPKDTYLEDRPSYSVQSLHDDFLEGIYIGKMGSETIADYDDLAALKASGKLRRLDGSYYGPPANPEYNSEYKENGKTFKTKIIHLTRRIELADGETLFLIVRSEPTADPANLTGNQFYTYKNDVKSSWDKVHWIEWIQNKNTLPAMVLYGSNGISKTLEKVSAWDGTEDRVIKPTGAASNKGAMAGQEKGTYISWNVQLNLTGRLHGDYYVEEQIPEGLELVYVQCTGIGAGYKGVKPTVVQNPLDGWKECSRDGTTLTYYYTKGQTARWYVAGLLPGGSNHTMDFRVLCRVTDGDVLQGGVNKEFNNQVELCREGGKVIDSASAPVTLKFKSLSKEKLDSTGLASIPFKITLNPEGADLVPGADTVSLVDTMGDTMRLIIESIVVTDTRTNTVITNWRASVDGQALTLELPDNTPLTVNYSAAITAKPGSQFAVSNEAHWQGYPVNADNKWEDPDYTFSVSGSVETDEPVSILITKRNQNDLSQTLPGAGFKLTEMELQNGAYVKANVVGSDFTDADGKLRFGVANNQLNPNTVYCLEETKAPQGFVLDSTPYYFVIAKKIAQADGTMDYPPLPADVNDAEVHIHYADDFGNLYEYDAHNRRGQIIVQKQFTYPVGGDRGPVAGTYSFGLYETPNGTGTPIQTVSITYSESDTEANKTAVFKDLDLTKTYYVFEVDGSGAAIANQGVLADRFTVTYDCLDGVTFTPGANDVYTPQDGSKTVTVTNRVHMQEFPATGGIGTEVFTILGWIMLAAATALLLTKKRRETQ